MKHGRQQYFVFYLHAVYNKSYIVYVVRTCCYLITVVIHSFILHDARTKQGYIPTI